MKQVIRLTEADLHNIIENSVRTALQENMTDEGVWNNVKAGANAFFGRGVGNSSQRHNAPNDTEVNYNLGKRWQAAKTNYKEQGAYDKKQELINQLKSFAQKYGDKITIGDLIKRINYSAMNNRSNQSYAINQIYK